MSVGADRDPLPLPRFDGGADAPDDAARDAPGDALDDFAPRTRRAAPEARRAVDSLSQFPSREPAADGQLNLKGPKPVLERFRAMCKADRRAYYDMLEVLMDHFEGKPKRG